MKNVTVWNTRAAGLALLAVAGGAWAAESDFSKPDHDRQVVKDVDPADYQHLDGAWQCHFLKAKGEIAQNYYSLWTFESAKKWVHVFWSPVHKGFVNGYHWNGMQLVLGDPSNPLQPTFGAYPTPIKTDGTLIIEDPRYRWQGWRCNRQSEKRWPADGLQFLDYGRYPWLSGLVEDGREIMKYRDPKAYQEWLKYRPR